MRVHCQNDIINNKKKINFSFLWIFLNVSFLENKVLFNFSTLKKNKTFVFGATERKNKDGKCGKYGDKERLKIDARMKIFEVDFRGFNES